MNYIVSLYHHGVTWHAQIYVMFDLHGRMLCELPSFTKGRATRKAVNTIHHIDDTPTITVRERTV